jgi:hypothetical protein
MMAIRVAVLALVALAVVPATAKGGYSHFLEWRRKPSEEEVRACVADMRKVIEAKRSLLAGPDGEGEPEAAEGRVAFNGRGQPGKAAGDAMEPFEFPGRFGRNEIKTGYSRPKPYDTVVCACLIVARDHFDGKSLWIFSNGQWEDDEWRAGAELYEEVFGRKPRDPFGLDDNETDRPTGFTTDYRMLILVLAVAVGIAVFAFYRRPEFTIQVRAAAVTIKGGVPEFRKSQIVHFFHHELGPAPHCTVRGYRDSQHQLRLKISGPLDEGERQRIRNFLMVILK